MNAVESIGTLAMRFMDDLNEEAEEHGEIVIEEAVITVHMHREDGKEAVGYRSLTKRYGRIFGLLQATTTLHVEAMMTAVAEQPDEDDDA